MTAKSSEVLTHDELCQKITDIFLINGAVTIEETESENFMLAIEDVVVMFDKVIKVMRDGFSEHKESH